MLLNVHLNATFAAPFNVGTGSLSDALTNKPTIKNGRDRAFIPASAFKGRLRHTCERLLRALQDSDYAACHAPDPAATCPLDPHWLNDYCPICLLFGSPKRPSPLNFSDWHWAGRQLEQPPTQIRTGVSIRRSRRVAEPQRLYDLETVDSLGSAYQGQIEGHLDDDQAQALAALLLAGLREFKTIGGGRGSGLGRCRLQVQMILGSKDVSQDEAWLRAGLTQLIHGGPA